MDLLGGDGARRDPAVIETELIRLRDDCAAIVRELEGRYERVMRVPRAIGDRTWRVEQAIERRARAHPALVGGVLAVGVSVLVVRRFVAARAERDIRLRIAARAVRWLGARRTASLLGALAGLFARFELGKARFKIGRARRATRRALLHAVPTRAFEMRMLPERLQAAILERRSAWLF